MSQISLLNLPQRESDVVYTPDWVVEDVIGFFNPRGLCLDPCRGNGAFFDQLPKKSEWCEISEGKDFFAYSNRVDWIVSNPPYSIFSEWLQHSFKIASNIVYLIPTNKPFNSYSLMLKIRHYGGIPHIRHYGPGSIFPAAGIGFAISAVHFKKEYDGPIYTSFAKEAT